jgi:hypothetical protein
MIITTRGSDVLGRNLKYIHWDSGLGLHGNHAASGAIRQKCLWTSNPYFYSVFTGDQRECNAAEINSRQKFPIPDVIRGMIIKPEPQIFTVQASKQRARWNDIDCSLDDVILYHNQASKQTEVQFSAGTTLNR